MPDEADRAQIHEEAFLADALARARRPRGRGPDMSDGTPRCRECGEEIPAARLARVPDAECCVSCQNEREGRQRPC
jgi:phage/conjugal plasmid C-4 type zinc finger TraR family protein